MRKKIFGMFIVVLMLTAALSAIATSYAGAQVEDPNGNKNMNGTGSPIRSGGSPEYLSLETATSNPVSTTLNNRGEAVFGFEEDQRHPGFGRANDVQVAAFRYDDFDPVDAIIYAYSVDDGQTFEDMVYWPEYYGDYPSIKLWGGERFFGTFVSDSRDNNGGDIHTFEFTDDSGPPNEDNYIMYTAGSSEHGFYGMKDADIACDGSQNDWEWGAHAIVISRDDDGTQDDFLNAPTIMFANPDQEGKVEISWYLDLDGCAYCDVAIDPVTHYMYAVYDRFDPDTSTWYLLCRKLDFTDPLDPNDDNIYEIYGAGNLQYPAIAAYDGNLVILAETDQNGNKDIICYYTDDGDVENLQTSFVVNTANNERYPDVRNVDGDDFASTYVKNSNLYATLTADGGATWSDTPWQINNNDGCVVEEYKTSDICEKVVYAMWEEDGGDDLDIFMELVNQAPEAPEIDGPAGGDPGTEYTYTFVSTDPEAHLVSYYIDWDDGNTEDWSDLQLSGTTYTMSHTWAEEGTYTIMAKAKDIFGDESDWGTFTITRNDEATQGSQSVPLNPLEDGESINIDGSTSESSSSS